MSISMSKYVNITSGVGGNNNVATRQLSGCVFTPNPMVDPLIPLFFHSSADVGLYFGTLSEEYTRAVKYFGYVSPAIRNPSTLMFGTACVNLRLRRKWAASIPVKEEVEVVQFHDFAATAVCFAQGMQRNIIYTGSSP